MTATSRTPLAPVVPIRADTHALTPLGLADARITGGMWGTWQTDNRRVSIPHGYGWLEREGSIHNLVDRTQYRGLRFTDSDFYKALEAVYWEIGRAGDDEELRALIERSVSAIEAGIGPDGYINSYVQAGRAKRYEDLAEGHELYCMGHLLEAAVVAHRATGDTRMLEIGVRVADQIDTVFGDNRRLDYEGHPEVELALVALYRVTGERRYLALADQFVTNRGHDGMNRGGFEPDYYQDAVPYREQGEVVGHAVRALYLISGALDVYLETGEEALLAASTRQWDDMAAHKLYVTGAVGSRFEGEAFGAPFELPPDLVYGETCASIALAQVAWRLLLITGERRYADAIEQVWYNVLAASTNHERDCFFYVNPLQRREVREAGASDRKQRRCDAPGTRPGWYECACCPPNIMRTIASLGAYVATGDSGGVQIHQYLPSTVRADGLVLEVSTDYPRSGAAHIEVIEAPVGKRSISLRIPGWASGATVVVGGSGVDGAGSAAEGPADGVVSDGAVSVTPDGKGYHTETRAWAAGDRLVLDLALAPRWVAPHPAADAVRGQIALTRGPVVYCVENVEGDSGIDLDRIAVRPTVPMESGETDIVGMFAPALALDAGQLDTSGWDGGLYLPVDAVPEPVVTSVEATAIPYALWANRGPSSMRVWLPKTR